MKSLYLFLKNKSSKLSFFNEKKDRNKNTFNVGLLSTPSPSGRVGVGLSPSPLGRAGVGLLFFFLLTGHLHAQQGIGVVNPHPSAALELGGISKGLLLPRVTTFQMNNISSPATGLMVYNTDLNCIHFYAGSWKSQCDPVNIGAWALLGSAGTTAGTHFIGTTDAQDLVVKANGVEGLRLKNLDNSIDIAGHLGVGVGTTPSAANITTVSEAQSNYASDFTGSHVSINATPTAAYGNTTYGNYATVTGLGTQNFTQSLIAGSFNANHAGTGTLNLPIGVNGNVNNNAAGLITQAKGVFGKVSNSSTGAITTAYGGDFSIFQTGGGSITNGYGVSSFLNQTGGSITNYYGFYVPAPSITGGTLTNNHGIHINDQIGGTTNYAIYSAGGQSYHAGNFGIGVAIPTYKLDVSAVANPVRFQGIQAGTNSDDLMTADAGGVLRKYPISTFISNNLWTLDGNTVGVIKKIGTKDNYDLPFITNDVERVRITGSGNVGIGTAAPAYKLDVVGAVNATSILSSDWARLATNGATLPANTQGAYTLFNNATVAGTAGLTMTEFVNHRGGGVGGFSFSNTGDMATFSELMRITGAGNVGIGTTAPSNKLEVVGTTASTILSAEEHSWLSRGSTTMPTTGNGAYTLWNNSALGGFPTNGMTHFVNHRGAGVGGFTFSNTNDFVSFTEYMRIKSTGEIGIGTATPAYKLDISAAANPLRLQGVQAGANTDDVMTTDAIGVLRKIPIATFFQNNAWSNTGNAGTAPATNFIGTTDAQDLVFRTSNTEKIRLTATGYLGLATTAPISLLSNTMINIAGTDNFGVNTQSIAWLLNSVGYVEGLYNKSTASAAQGLAVKIAGTASTNRILDLSTGATQNVAGTSVMLVQGDGKVGIANTTPLTRLDLGTDLTDAKLYLYSNATDPYGFGLSSGQLRIFSGNSTPNNGATFGSYNGTTFVPTVKIENQGRIGIGTTTPNTALDIDGAIATRPLLANVTVDNQVITVGNRSFIRVTSDFLPTNRTITLTNGLQDGQQLILRISATGPNGVELDDTTNMNLSGLAQLDDGDTLTLIWDGTQWFETGRSNN
jgi:hypothetical protein